MQGERSKEEKEEVSLADRLRLFRTFRTAQSGLCPVCISPLNKLYEDIVCTDMECTFSISAAEQKKMHSMIGDEDKK